MSLKLKNEFDFDYKNIILQVEKLTIREKDTFIYHEKILYRVESIKWDEVILDWWKRSTTNLLVRVFIYINSKILDYSDKPVPFIVMVYTEQNKVVLLYKDITYIGSYYWNINNWLEKNINNINDYFYNIIDEEVTKWIDSIEINSDTVLKIVNKYNLPFSRDLMLTQAIDKYSNEMSTLLDSINDPTLKKRFMWVIKTIKWIASKDKEEVEPSKDKVVSKVKKATPAKRKTTLKK